MVAILASRKRISRRKARRERRESSNAAVETLSSPGLGKETLLVIHTIVLEI